MQILLYTRRGCHLCHEAEDMVAAAAPAESVTIVDVDADETARGLYGDRVPVLVRDGKVMLAGRFDERLLHRLLAGREATG